MPNAIAPVPVPVNEPVRSYAPGSPERASLKKKLDEMMSSHSHHGNAAHSHGSEDQGSNSRPHQ